MAETESTEDFLSRAREEYDLDRQADQLDREAAEEDNLFAYADDKNLDQWDKRAKKVRGNKRPILQWNRIPVYTQRIANDSRKNKPAIRIAPGDEDATKHTAEYLQARIRHIEYESNVDTARDTVGKQQVVTGRGFMRVSTEWIPGTEKQRIVVDAIPNQFSVVWDRGSMKYDKTDADRCFVIQQLTKAQYLHKYGQECLDKALDFASDQPDNGWVGVGKGGDGFQIADYWHKKYKTVHLPSGRIEKVATIYSCAIDGAQILIPQEVWTGSTIPIIPVWGEQAINDGIQRTFSLIRNAKTPQRDLNLAISTLAELVGQMPKSPYMIPEGAIAANRESDWANALNTPLAYLLYQQYNPDNPSQQYNKPERTNQEPAIQSTLEWINIAIDAIKSSMGIFDAALGQRSNEQSGVAIERRKVQGEITNLHFPDNQARSNKYLGEVLVELIMKMERKGSYPIRTEDGKTHLVPMGVEHNDWKTGAPVTHDLSTGQYGTTVSNGPSFDTARQEKHEQDIAVVQANPEMLYAIGGSMLRSDDSPGADERADAWEQYVTLKIPGMKFTKPGQAPNQPDPKQMEQELQKMGQELQVTQKFAQDLHQKLEGKQMELAQQSEIEKMKIEFQYAQLKVTDENKKLEIASKESIEQLEHDIEILKAEHQRQHEAAMMAQQQAHAMDTQTGQQAHESGEAEAQRQAAADTQQKTQDFTAQQADEDRAIAEQQQQGEE